MTETSISEGMVMSQDAGTGLASGETVDRVSAGNHALLASHVEGEYVGAGLGFDAIGSGSVTLTQGHAFVGLDSVKVQLRGSSNYDADLPDPVIVAVVIPDDVDLALDADAVNDVYLAFDRTQNSEVYIRHGSNVSEPSDPSLHLGTIDTSDGSSSRANDDVQLAHDVDAGGRDISGVGSIGTEDLAIIGDSGKAHTVEPNDGSDSAGIMEAHDDASPGDTLILKPNTEYVVEGTYSDGPIIPITKSGISIVGFGPRSTIKPADGTSENEEGVTILDIEDGADDVTLDHFAVDGNYQNQGTIGTSDGHNIAVFGDDSTLTRIYSRNGTGDGIEAFQGAEGMLVDNCHLQNNFEHNLGLSGCNGVQVSNCILEGGQADHISTYAASGKVTQNVSLKGLEIIGGQGDALNLTGGPGSVKDIRVGGDTRIRNPAGIGARIVTQNGADETTTDINLNDVTIVGATEGVRFQGGVIDSDATDVTIRKTDETAVNFVSNGDYTDIDVEADIYDPGMASSVNAIELNPNDNTLTRVNVHDSRVISKDPESAMSKAINTFVGGSGGFVDCNVYNSTFHGHEDFYAMDAGVDGLEVRNNDGFVTENGGETTVDDGGTISHGLDETPNQYYVEATDGGTIASVTDVGSNNLTVEVLSVSDGSSAGSGNNVVWGAKYR